MLPTSNPFRSFLTASKYAQLASRSSIAGTSAKRVRISRYSSSTHNTPSDDVDCPELPSTPSWSLQSILQKRDVAIKPDQPDSEEITPDTIDHLLRLAHLQKPTDPNDLAMLQRDVIRMRNFLDYIRANSPESQQCREAEETEIRFPLRTSPELVQGLRSLVDDGHGLRTRATTSSVTIDSQDPERDLLRHRDVLLERPKRVKGNFFVVGAELDPKEGN
ncbi:hypothetical protein BGZ52_010475 [Haplosporangium bisporale]|nr:hypothetical protein BGZ52_010475 [Haplosporangium bisporale]KAF9215218.1 hypothetical protein BGZ59_001956 [Podila verticillata]KFH64283.1 hypothetical protein MVEG_10108 [Podila verticillata NRRL 6337]